MKRLANMLELLLVVLLLVLALQGLSFSSHQDTSCETREAGKPISARENLFPDFLLVDQP
jgi:hypothetical protein